MANVRKMIQYINNIEIYYGRYIVKITFDFMKLKFKAYTECGMNCMCWEIEDKQKYLSAIDECLTKVRCKHTKEILNIKERNCNYETYYKYETDDKPVCYIELEDFLNWLTLMKLKGTLH